MIGVLFDVLYLALAGLALYVALRVAGWVLEVLPVSRARRDLTERAWPVIVGLGVIVYVLFTVGVLLEDGLAPRSIAGVVVLFVVIALSWSVLRDAALGVYLRASRACRVGDFVRIDDIEGRVDRMGWRAMVVVTPSDSEAVVPYARAVGTAIDRTPKRAEAYPHAFHVELPEGRSVGATKQVIRRAALLSHWSSVVREPVVTLADDKTLAVTVFALDAERGYEIEAAVRRALAATRGASSKAPASKRTVFET